MGKGRFTEAVRKKWHRLADEARGHSEYYNTLYDNVPAGAEYPQRFEDGCYSKYMAWLKVAEAIEETLLVPEF